MLLRLGQAHGGAGFGSRGLATRIVAHRYAKELLFLTIGYLLYIGVKQLLVRDLDGLAFENARKVIDAELALRIYWEPTIQSWLMESARWVVVFFNWVYTLGFFPVLIPAALVVFIFRYRTYVYYRNVFLISYLFTWLLYLTFPVAPPRMMPEHGYVDSIEVLGPAIYNYKETISYYNQYSAMPSMHFGWTLLFGIMFLKSGRRPLQVFGVLYPALSFVAIVVTANHYILDALVGGFIIIFSYGIYVGLRGASQRLLPQPAGGGGPRA